MDENIKSLIAAELSNSLILKEAEVNYSGIRIVEYRTYYDSGRKFIHENGDNYAIAFLNAFTEKGYQKIVDTIKSDSNIECIKTVIEENRLKQYVHANTKTYSEWRTGDEGKVYLKKLKNSDDYELAGFSNLTAERRIRS